MISEFIYSGTFNDPFNEFFVEKIYNQGKGKKSMKTYDFLYRLSSDIEKIPSFLGENMALAIFKVGSHVHLLQMVNAGSQGKNPDFTVRTMEKIEHVDKQEYYNICNVSNSTKLMKRQEGKGPDNSSESIHHLISDDICLELKFNINELKTDLNVRQRQFQEQIAQLKGIEEAIINSEQKQFEDIIQLKQESVEKFHRRREQRLRE